MTRALFAQYVRDAFASFRFWYVQRVTEVNNGENDPNNEQDDENHISNLEHNRCDTAGPDSMPLEVDECNALPTQPPKRI